MRVIILDFNGIYVDESLSQLMWEKKKTENVAQISLSIKNRRN